MTQPIPIKTRQEVTDEVLEQWLAESQPLTRMQMSMAIGCLIVATIALGCALMAVLR